MFSMKHLQGVITNDTDRKTSSSKSKKSGKRKRQLSKRETNDEITSFIPLEDKHTEKENQTSNAADSLNTCHGDNPKYASESTYPASKKKKPHNIRKASEFLKTKNEESPRVTKKKKKEKKKINSVIQNPETETEFMKTKNICENEEPTRVTKKKKREKEKGNSVIHNPENETEFMKTKNICENEEQPKVMKKKKRKKEKGNSVIQNPEIETEFMKTMNICENEEQPRVMKKKKKKKEKGNSVIQNPETETEACFTFSGIPEVVTSKAKTKGKKAKLSISKSQQYTTGSVSNHLENSSSSKSKSNSDNTNASKKALPVKHGASFNVSKKAKHIKNKKAPLYKMPCSQQEGKLSGKEKRKQDRESRAAFELNVKQKILGYPVEMINVNKDTFIVVFYPGQSLYIHGLLSVRSLVGKVSILGYKLQGMEVKPMFSFSSHALLSIKGLEGCKLNASQHSYLVDFGLTSEQIQEIVNKQTEPVVVLELQKCVLPILKQLSIIGQKNLMTPKGNDSEKNLWGMLITQENCSKYHLTNETAQWEEMKENICLTFECGNVPRVVVCGGKGVGKSTLFKYVVNSLLSKRGTKVQCLDIDPGQTEMSMPSCISLTQETEPLLGPPYTHHADPSSPNVHQRVIGGVSPQFGLQRYIKAVKHLFELSQNHSDCPLVVNTMGWTEGTGFDLILDTIRIVQPTHVIQIYSSNPKANFDIALTDNEVFDALGGILTKPGESELHYSLKKIKSVSPRKDMVVSFTSKLLRELAVMLHLSNLISNYLHKADQEKTDNIVIIQWSKVVLHVCGPKVPKQRILQVLNGNLVVLCHVDSSKIESVSPDLPKHLINDLDFGNCIGWGVIRAIDPITKELHILTAVSSDTIHNEVNAIIKPELHLPDKFYGFFTKGEGPYYQTMYRTGAGKLKVGRQIKPKMAKLGPRKTD